MPEGFSKVVCRFYGYAGMMFMLMRDILNEFEADWASVPTLPEKYDFSPLRGKTFLVFGNSAARCVAYSLLYFNDEKNLGINVIITGETSHALKNFHPDILSRNDFRFLTLEELDSVDKVDYILDGGFCCEQFSGAPEEFIREISQRNAVIEFAKRCRPDRYVLLSDSRVYGKPQPYRIYSEGEMSVDRFENDINAAETQILRTIETLLSSAQKEIGFDLTILRTGMILGACAKIHSPLDKVFESAAGAKSCELYNSDTKITVTYITDVLKAVYMSITDLKSNAVYNISRNDSTVSTGEISAMLKNIYGGKCKIHLSELGGEKFAYAPINGSKTEFNGCESKISLQTAMELCVMSYSEEGLQISPTIHDGRLKTVQQLLLGFILDVDRICRKHNIQYFLGGGTLLGAVRHGGFIPWDDDADIMMLRKDYDKFLELAPSELHKGLSLQSNVYDKNCHYEFSKIRLDNTVFATVFSREHTEMHNGLSLDIFCHDATANSSLGRKLHKNATIFFRALVFNKWNHRKMDNGNKAASFVGNFCKRVFPLNFSQKLLNKTMSLFKNKKNPRYLYDGMGRNIYNGEFPASYLSKAVYVDFEGYKLPVPAEYDKYLKYLYGDYMKLPPASQRIQCHDIKLFDLGEYSQFTLKSDIKP